MPRLSNFQWSLRKPSDQISAVQDNLFVTGKARRTSVAPIAEYPVVRYSDRTGGRLGPFRLCAMAGFLGWAGIALSTAARMPFAISAFVLAFSGTATSQIFAAVHDDIKKTPDQSTKAFGGVFPYRRLRSGDNGQIANQLGQNGLPRLAVSIMGL
ncbi:MAG: hypothetical protein ABI832_13695 [bacterium]